MTYHSSIQLPYCVICHVSIYANSYAAGINHQPWNLCSSMKQKYMFLMLQIHPKMMCALFHTATWWPNADRAPTVIYQRPQGVVPFSVTTLWFNFSDSLAGRSHVAHQTVCVCKKRRTGYEWALGIPTEELMKSVVIFKNCFECIKQILFQLYLCFWCHNFFRCIILPVVCQDPEVRT